MKTHSASKSRGLLKLLLTSAKAWNADNGFSYAAAVSFYTLFSLAPITLIVTSIAGFFFGKETANAQFIAQLTQLVGKESAKAVIAAAASNAPQNRGWLSTVVAVAILLVGATTVFAQLQDSLNDIWGVTAKPSRSGILVLVFQRLVSFAMVLTVGFVLLVSLFVSTGLTSLLAHITIDQSKYLVQGIDVVVGLGVVTVLFALVLKILPDVVVPWRQVWLGALVNAVLFAIGRFLIALYLSHSNVASIYGAAGSLVALLVWVYYSSAILFFGAEFTRAAMTQKGLSVQPKENAVRVRSEILS